MFLFLSIVVNDDVYGNCSLSSVCFVFLAVIECVVIEVAVVVVIV